MIKINADKDDFGDIMIMALRYALGRKTYATLEVSDFIRNNINLINERICIVMLKDIKEYFNRRSQGIIIDDECDHKTWLTLYESLYKIAKTKDYISIGVE